MLPLTFPWSIASIWSEKKLRFLHVAPIGVLAAATYKNNCLP